eukprot:776503-Prymnesium_polylepis.1
MASAWRASLRSRLRSVREVVARWRPGCARSEIDPRDAPLAPTPRHPSGPLTSVRQRRPRF